MVLSRLFGISKDVAMIYLGLVGIILGAIHVVDPAGSGVGMILNASNELTNLAGLITRFVGLSVIGAGSEVLSEAY